MDVKRIHILVVDDFIDTAESAAELLTLWGYDATACNSGARALACSRERRPDAVLLDIAMPGMDGFQFAQTFHLLPGCEAVPLVAVSGYASPEFCARARESGIGHCLLKPADPERLKAILALITRGAAVPSVLRIEAPWGARSVRSRRRLARVRAASAQAVVPA